MKGDIAFAGFVLTAEEWQALDREARTQLLDVATRRFPTGTEPPYQPGKVYVAGGTIETGPMRAQLAEGSGPLECDEYIDLDLND